MGSAKKQIKTSYNPVLNLLPNCMYKTDKYSTKDFLEPKNLRSSSPTNLIINVSSNCPVLK